MRYLVITFIMFCLLMGCSSSQTQAKKETYPYAGYSCRESLAHLYSHCYDENLTKEEFEEKVKACEKELATEVCAREQADLLWCQGRVERGKFKTGMAFCPRGFCFGTGSTSDGCDCSSFSGALKECRMKKGIFEEKK